MKSKTIIVLLLLVSNLIQSQNLTDSLKAHYKFDNSLVDETIYANHLEMGAGVELYVNVMDLDNAIVCDESQQITTSSSFDNSAYEAITISLWFKTSNITDGLQIMLQGAYMGFGIYMAPNTGRAIGFFDGSSSGAIQSNEVLSDGEWHHVVMQSDGSETSMYVDGLFNGSFSENMNVGNGGSNNRLFIGQSTSGYQPFTGTINEVRIYNRFLSKQEIEILSEGPVTTSLDEAVLENPQSNIKLFPNPASTYVQIEPQQAYEYELFSLTGKMLREGKGTVIDLSGIDVGVYFVRLDGVVRKLVVGE